MFYIKYLRTILMSIIILAVVMYSFFISFKEGKMISLKDILDNLMKVEQIIEILEDKNPEEIEKKTASEKKLIQEIVEDENPNPEETEKKTTSEKKLQKSNIIKEKSNSDSLEK